MKLADNTKEIERRQALGSGFIKKEGKQKQTWNTQNVLKSSFRQHYPEISENKIALSISSERYFLSSRFSCLVEGEKKSGKMARDGKYFLG